ncbi:hypothetical protein PPTG_14165 [Phytophthora nicotianae INRA-310]|uniref:Uncharacterized protein n=1 Tax=Phytophthora nicotianae (strain INRA-310) TaxID=761204 RepID=W2PZH0_PHYN3|nr:hypothetical protein PPTG_14165 [Phytophthora nicotianae INRA-310]ETN05425.1 hypothetical protein PPTG_14165 [Phytophthora nicotianae INRA-310]
MKQALVHCVNEGPSRHLTNQAIRRNDEFATAERKLLVMWFVLGLAPLILQTRSFLKFVTPHKVTTSLVVPPDVDQKTVNMTELCPALGLQMAQVWWNFETTHYYDTQQGRLCHIVSPQYNCHGNYVVGTEKSKASSQAPTSCINNSFVAEMYFYHGTIGFYSFYEEITGTYCTTDPRDGGSHGYRMSYWFATVGTVWILYRAIVFRRSYVSSHGAANYHRVVLLYLLVEGIMSDLFLLVATDEMFAWLQYISFGYNLSGLVLLLFEMIENMGWLNERTRLCIKRLLFSYESSLFGELLSAIGQSHFLTSLSHSDLKDSGSTARAVSYYVWGLVGHGVIVLPLIGFIMSVRIVRAITYTRWRYGVDWNVFIAPCSVDTTLGMLSKMMMLRGYEWMEGELCYKRDALKAFGILRMEEDGAEFLALRKLCWFHVPRHELAVIGAVSGQRVEPCTERPCLGVVGFFDRSLGGSIAETGRQRLAMIHGRSRSILRPAPLHIFPAP